MNIITQSVYPPIPTRIFDWCAYWEGTGEDGRYGWGKTQAEAIADLELAYPQEEEL